MHRSSVDDWIRFYDEVIVAGGDWTPDAWYGAVGEAMAKALPADSPILDTWRRRVDELLALQGAPSGSEEDERRIGALEAEIQRLIGAADEVIRTPRSVPATTPPPAEMIQTRRVQPRRSVFRAIGQTAAALVLIGAGLLGALYLYDTRLALRVDREFERYVGGLRSTVEQLQRDLQIQIQANLSEQERLDRARQDLEHDVATFDDKMTESLGAMTALRESATADLQRRLDARAGSVIELLEQAKGRADRLGQVVDEVSEDIVALEQAMPAVNQRLTRLSSEAAQGDSVLAEVMSRLAALDRLAPEVERLADARRQELENAASRERAELATLGTMIDELRSAYQHSAQQLAGARMAVDHELNRAAEERDLMRRAVSDLETSRGAISSLSRDVESELDLARQAIEARADELLEGLAERADLAVMRGDGVLERAEKQLVRELEAAGQEALAAYFEKRERELTGLADEVARTRSELDRTRTSLIDSWQRMDEEAAERQRALLAELDDYAAEVEARVDELMAALDVVAAAEQASPR
ncbi:MAG: hypothetical protein R3349_06040 [Geminicoccaceae bacterium]|nr:hypothetical protein [Geminicoccaceae bacterium]